jgi:hypothetical protein
LSTSSAAARDAYVDASERALTFYPGALPAELSPNFGDGVRDQAAAWA